MQTSSDIAERLQKAIIRSRRSLYDIAKGSGLGYSAVYRIAHRERDTMTIETLLKLAATLGLTVELRPNRRRKSKA